MKRCLVCNAESFHLDFCSQECEAEYSDLMDEIDDNLNYSEDEECELLSDYTKTEGED